MTPNLYAKGIASCILLIFCLVISSRTNGQIITTVAGGFTGDGKVASTIGLGQVATMAVDKNENIYFSERISGYVRKVSGLTGVITTVAGVGFSSPEGNPAYDSYLGGAGLAAITCDLQGNVYLSSANRLLKIDVTSGNINVIAGKGSGFSGDNGPAKDASFNRITSIAVDNSGNIYLHDDFRIRKINSATGIVTTIAGNGMSGNSGDNGLATSATISTGKLAADGAGNIYFTQQNMAIRRIDASTNIITTFAGTVNDSGVVANDVAIAQARFASMLAIATDDVGNIYVSDRNYIRRISTSTGRVTVIAGTGQTGAPGDGGLAANANMITSTSIGVGSNGNLYFEDINNSRAIRKVNLSTMIITRHAGNGTVGVSGIPGPLSEAQFYLSQSNFTMDDAKNLYITDATNHKIYKVDAAAKYVSVIAGTGVAALNADNGMLATQARIMTPSGIARDKNGNIYFTENNVNIRKIDGSTGIISKVAGTGAWGYSGDGGPAINAALSVPNRLTTDENNNLYISDRLNHVIRKVTVSTGVINTIAGNHTQAYKGDGGAALSASLSLPDAIYMHTNGDLFIYESGNYVVRKISGATGIITTVAGNGTVGNSGDNGLATGAQLSSGGGVVLDKSGNLYTAGGAAVRKVDSATGIITRYAGSPQSNIGYNGDNIPALTAVLNLPNALNTDSDGNIYIFDMNNNRIRKVTPAPTPKYEGILYGRVFYDNNADGIQNNGESFANGITVSSKKNNTEIRTTTTNGVFKILADTGTYKTQPLLLDFYFAPEAISIFTTTKNSDTILFALKPIPDKNDLQLSLYPETLARPGFSISYAIPYRNDGTKDAQNVKLFFVKSSRLAIDSTQPAYTSLSGDTLTWTLNTITKNTNSSVRIFAKVPPPPLTNFNDSLFSTAYFSQQGVDIRPQNDTAKLKERVTGAYDPNDKTELHGGVISPQQLASGEYLQYLIRFQNTGNDTAFNVVVTDTLPGSVDLTTLQIIGTSHNYVLTIQDGNKLKWTFSNILLPDSNRNSAKSHGFIAFKIKPSSSLVTGSKIENKADIYFDFNPPITTNFAATVIKELPTPPLKPVINSSVEKYCLNATDQKLKVQNKGSNKALIWMDKELISINADNEFIVSPSKMTIGNHLLHVMYFNESGENTLSTILKIENVVTPEIKASSGKTLLISDQETVIVSAIIPKNSGTTPLYSFAKDRGFTTVFQSEGPSSNITIQGVNLNNGDNWIYVRMKSSELCTSSVYALDSVKITKTLTTTAIIDVDNPGVSIINYPNPVTHTLYVSGLSVVKKYQLQFYNSNGVLVKTVAINNQTSKSIPCSDLVEGFYWLRVIDVKKNQMLGTLKVLKQ